ncbi:protein kinase domain-containing protein [Ditylenchus destructor]|uniref:Protein kinase domain-containing protein n=1 Tax=Ditylenchus destructor TaxID=166010 RepID=A0AAD4QSL2_9BILA|nr:protein kinase domain-containing protein [Ditylenchus destructor]
MSRSRYTVNAGQKVSSTPMKPEEKQQPQTPRSRESSKRPEERRTPPMPDGSKTLRRREQSVATVNVQIQNAQSGTIDNRANTVRGLTHSSGSRQIQNELLAKAQLPPQHRFTTLRRSDPTENLRNKFKMHATAIDLPRTRHSSGGTSNVNDYKRVEEYYKSKDGKVTVWIVKDKDGRYFIRKDMTYDPVNKLDNECVHEVNVFHRLHSDPTPSRFIVRAYAWDTLSDFEYAHLCQPKDANSCTNTDFAGSDPYMAPEIVENLEHSYAVDWWSLGVVLHFMIYFSVPFDGLFPYTKENIHLYKPRFPKNINVSKQLAGEDFAGKSMLQLLLEADPEKRSNGCKDLLNHPWLKNVSDIEKDVLEDLEQPRPNLRLLKKFAKWSGQQKSAFRKALEERQHKEALADLNNQIDDLLGDFNQDFNQDVIESTEQPEFDTLESDIMKKLNAIPTLKPTKRPVRLPKIVPLEQT